MYCAIVSLSARKISLSLEMSSEFLIPATASKLIVFVLFFNQNSDHIAALTANVACSSFYCRRRLRSIYVVKITDTLVIGVPKTNILRLDSDLSEVLLDILGHFIHANRLVRRGRCPTLATTTRPIVFSLLRTRQGNARVEPLEVLSVLNGDVRVFNDRHADVLNDGYYEEQEGVHDKVGVVVVHFSHGCEFVKQRITTLHGEEDVHARSDRSKCVPRSVHDDYRQEGNSKVEG